jgi:membrane-bound lytic murein transglycosylase B
VLAAIVLTGLAARPGGARIHPATAIVVTAPVASRVAAATSSGVSSSPRVRVSTSWVRRTAAGTGIPEPAVRAYGEATLLVASSDPGCHLGWTTLAGIGQVESGHGTGSGRTLGQDGRSSAPIVGPTLDGSGGVAALRSTPASARWHGDATWEHAVGPMQFLSSTWGRWGVDGDGDGAADPLDLDDAAYAAGRYLCADRHDLATPAGWSAAVFSYNHDAGYVRAVSAAALGYASAE